MRSVDDEGYCFSENFCFKPTSSTEDVPGILNIYGGRTTTVVGPICGGSRVAVLTPDKRPDFRINFGGYKSSKSDFMAFDDFSGVTPAVKKKEGERSFTHSR